MDSNNNKPSRLGMFQYIKKGLKSAALPSVIAQTYNTFGGNGSQKSGLLEPLPFPNYSLFEETHDVECMKINVKPFTNRINYIFWPNTPIRVKIKAEKNSGADIFHYVYTIHLKHSSKYHWEVKRSYDEFKEMHASLIGIVEAELGYAVSDIPPEQIQPDWPLFPKDHDFSIGHDELENRCAQLSEYLERLLTYPPFREQKSVLGFIAVSPLSFVTEVSPSVMEGWLQKRMRDNNHYGYLNTLKTYTYERWMILKDTYMVYLNRELDSKVGSVFLIDRGFECRMKTRVTAYYSLIVTNLSGYLDLKCKSYQQQLEWYNKIQQAMASPVGRMFCNPTYLPNESYAPKRRNQKVNWYINAATYMEHVMIALNNAKEEIYIADWWLTPELYLKRPTTDLQFRLDKILIKKAKEGIKVYILLFKEVSFAISLLSLRVKEVLTQSGQNPNIKVIRHPEHSTSGVFLWSHHEKFVIIDQSVAFLGGVDLCLGRWDDDSHRLVDLGYKKNITDLKLVEKAVLNFESREPSNSFPRNPILRLGKIFRSNSDTSPTLNKESGNNQTSIMEKLDENMVEPDPNATNMLVAALMGVGSVPSSPNVDVKFDIKPTIDISTRFESKSRSKSIFSLQHGSISGRTRTPSFANERSRSESSIQRNKLAPSEIERIMNEIRSWKKTHEKKEVVQNRVSSASSSSEGENMKSVVSKLSISLTNEGYYWIGKDYANSYKADFKDIADFSRDQFNREEVPRMPWHDQACVVIGESARDLARHFIQRWNQCKREKLRHVAEYPFLIPKTYSDLFENHYQDWFPDNLFTCTVQMTRSLDYWSGGITKTESSILQAYYHYIRKAEHYIYIENQFFITTTEPKKDFDVKNSIGYELVKKIIQSHEQKKKFKVYVVLPLLPGFESQNAIQAIQFFNLRSICLGEYSIFKELETAGINPNQYITFHGMRNWGVLMGNLVQEIVYVHSKLMIVDDKYVICGSANINDRSMLGKRDSEVAAVIKDEEFIEGVLDGSQVEVGKYANSLRKKIFSLNIGSYPKDSKKFDIEDCASDEFFEFFRSISRQNTETYDEVFKCIPSDNILTFEQLANYYNLPCLSKTDPVKGKEKLDSQINGFIVDFPLKFLSQERTFYPVLSSREGIAPISMWT